jgi:hypothetical protein
MIEGTQIAAGTPPSGFTQKLINSTTHNYIACAIVAAGTGPSNSGSTTDANLVSE